MNARDRIGAGPWHNAKGARVAQNVADLHGDTLEAARRGNNMTKVTAINEKGETINGVGDTPNRHDMLTGSQLDGTAFTDGADHTCQNWTSSTTGTAQLGHHDRTGGGNTSWNSTHPSRGCSQGESGRHRRRRVCSTASRSTEAGAVVPAAIKPTVTRQALEAVDIRVGTIVRVEDMPKAAKLVRLIVDFGDHQRLIIAGVKQERADARELENRQALFVVNLEPKTIMGEESQGMLFDIGYAADGVTPCLAVPERLVPNGARAG